jgi:hypothetical protein
VLAKGFGKGLDWNDLQIAIPKTTSIFENIICEQFGKERMGYSSSKVI